MELAVNICQPWDSGSILAIKFCRCFRLQRHSWRVLQYLLLWLPAVGSSQEGFRTSTGYEVARRSSPKMLLEMFQLTSHLNLADGYW